MQKYLNLIEISFSNSPLVEVIFYFFQTSRLKHNNFIGLDLSNATNMHSRKQLITTLSAYTCLKQNWICNQKT